MWSSCRSRSPRIARHRSASTLATSSFFENISPAPEKMRMLPCRGAASALVPYLPGQAAWSVLPVGDLTRHAGVDARLPRLREREERELQEFFRRPVAIRRARHDPVGK